MRKAVLCSSLQYPSNAILSCSSFAFVFMHSILLILSQMAEQKTGSQNQLNRPVTEPAVPALDPKLPKPTALTASLQLPPPPASLPVVDAGRNLSQVASKSKLPLSAPVVIPDTPQVQREVFKVTENIVPDADVRGRTVMETDPVEERPAETISVPVVARTPEFQSHEIMHSPSNNPLPSPSTTPLPQGLLVNQPQREQEQPQDTHTSGSNPDSTNNRFGAMLSTFPPLNIPSFSFRGFHLSMTTTIEL